MAGGLLRASLQRAVRLPNLAVSSAWACLRVAAACETSCTASEVSTSLVSLSRACQLLPNLQTFQRALAGSAVAALKPAVYHVEVVTGDVRGAGSQVGP